MAARKPVCVGFPEIKNPGRISSGFQDFIWLFFQDLGNPHQDFSFQEILHTLKEAH